MFSDILLPESIIQLLFLAFAAAVTGGLVFSYRDNNLKRFMRVFPLVFLGIIVCVCIGGCLRVEVFDRLIEAWHK